MAFGRTADSQKEAERSERDRLKADERAGRERQKADEKAAKERAAAEAAFLRSPVGRASAASAEGAGFFHVELEMSEVGRSNLDLLAGYSGAPGVERKRAGHGGVLAQIEDVGWRLEHVGYVYVETGQVSRDKLLSSGQQVATLGKTVGHFLFRRAELAAPMTPMR
jgi:hypothetical protein